MTIAIHVKLKNGAFAMLYVDENMVIAIFGTKLDTFRRQPAQPTKAPLRNSKIFPVPLSSMDAKTNNARMPQF